MKSEEEEEKEMLQDLDYIYSSYRELLTQGTSSVTNLNTLIRALKHVHRYFNQSDNNLNQEEYDK